MAGAKRRNDPEGIRERIVDAAYDAFVGQGYGATGMAELRERAAVSGGALAHHFPVKRDLGLAVIRDRLAGTVAETWIDPLRRAADAPSGIDRIFEAIIDELSARGRVAGCPLNNLAMDVGPHDGEMRAALDGLFTAWQQALSAKFRTDMAEGRAGPFDPDRLAAFVVAAYSGAMAMARTRQSVEPLVQCRLELVALFRRKYEAGR